MGESGRRVEGVRPAAVNRGGSRSFSMGQHLERGERELVCGCVEARSGHPFYRVRVRGGEGTEERGGHRRWWSHSMASVTNQEGETEEQLTNLEKGKRSRHWVAHCSLVQ
jgi:hypothetical protein